MCVCGLGVRSASRAAVESRLQRGGDVAETHEWVVDVPNCFL